MRKKFLQKRIARLQQKISDLRARAQASTDVEEVRTIQTQIEEIREDLNDANEELAAIEADEAAAAEAAPAAGEGEEGRSLPPAGAQLVNGQILASHSTPESREETDWSGTMEYRRAFMNYVQTGAPIPQDLIPAEVRQSATGTADTGAAIPITVMNEVINTVRLRYGNLYNKVRKLNVQGGVKFPVGALKARFTWINEKSVAPRQKAGELGDVAFYYNEAEIRVSQTLLSSILTLSAFEATVAEEIAIAFLEAMDVAIVNGSGEGAPLGILNDPRVTNVVEMTATDFSNWKAWREKFFAKLPLGYKAGEFIFTSATVESKLLTMSDANGNPIFNQATGLVVNDGDAVNPNGRFYGREVSLVEPNIIEDFDTAGNGDVVGIFWQPRDYAFNENFGFMMRRYFDEETNEWVDKALIITDGKVLNPTGYYLIKKKSS